MGKKGSDKKGKSGTVGPDPVPIAIAIVLIAIIAVVVVGLALMGKFSPASSAEPAETADTPAPTAAPEPVDTSEFAGYRLKDHMETVLIFGVDKFEKDTHTESYNNTQQADFFMLLVFDDDAEETRAIAINRDTMTDVMVLGVRGEKAGYKTMQLALSHNYGSGGNDSSRNTVDAVSKLLKDVEIDHFICLTMDAIPIINDLCGGVTVTLDEDLTELNENMTAGTSYTLMGDEALSFVRARMSVSDGTNISRMKRQQQYLQALSEKLMAVPEDDDKAFILKLTSALSDYMQSDCSVTQLDKLFDKGQAYANEGFFSIKGKDVEGERFMEFYPDEAALTELVRDVFYEKVG